MALRPEHEIHQRRLGRNLGVGLTLGVFIVLVFLMTIVKVEQVGQASSQANGQAADADNAADGQTKVTP